MIRFTSCKMYSRVDLPDSGFPVVLLFLIVLIQHNIMTLQAATLTVRTPVNPVQEGGILSLHCEVKNLERDREVTIFRNTSTGIEKLSVNDDVLPAAGDEVFLAKRQLEGATFVYFISLIHVSKEDSGEYFCKIADVAGQKTDLPVASLIVQTTYFPPASDPICTPTNPGILLEGDLLTLSCSSEHANPRIGIAWFRTGSKSKLRSKENSMDGRVYLTSDLRITLTDEGAIFICKITSDAYPEREQTCHVGPIRVLSKSGSTITKPDNTRPEHFGHPTTQILANVNPDLGGKDVTLDRDRLNCDSVCVSEQSSLLHWILATSVAVVFAFIFLIVCIALFMKTRRIDAETNRPPSTYVRPPDGIYTELECRRSQNKVYLPIEHNIKFDTQQLS